MLSLLSCWLLGLCPFGVQIMTLHCDIRFSIRVDGFLRPRQLLRLVVGHDQQMTVLKATACFFRAFLSTRSSSIQTSTRHTYKKNTKGRLCILYSRIHQSALSPPQQVYLLLNSCKSGEILFCTCTLNLNVHNSTHNSVTTVSRPFPSENPSSGLAG